MPILSRDSRPTMTGVTISTKPAVARGPTELLLELQDEGSPLPARALRRCRRPRRTSSLRLFEEGIARGRGLEDALHGLRVGAQFAQALALRGGESQARLRSHRSGARQVVAQSRQEGLRKALHAVRLHRPRCLFGVRGEEGLDQHGDRPRLAQDGVVTPEAAQERAAEAGEPLADVVGQALAVLGVVVAALEEVAGRAGGAGVDVAVEVQRDDILRAGRRRRSRRGRRAAAECRPRGSAAPGSPRRAACAPGAGRRRA